MKRSALALTFVLCLAMPASVYAATPSAQTSGPTAAPVDTMSGTIDLQKNALNGQVSVGRGSIGFDVTLADAGPQGQLTLGVPDEFSVSVSTANGIVQSAICGVIGPQAITVNAAQGSGLQVEFHNAAKDAAACAQAGASYTMAPYVGAVQVAQLPADDTVQQDGADVLRRFLVLALVAGLFFLFAPGLATPLAIDARTSPWRHLGLGLGVVIAVPVIGVLIFVLGLTLGLWWVGLLVLMAFAFLLAASLAMTGLVLGAWILDRLRRAHIPSVVAFGLGLLALAVLGLLPAIGALVNVVAVTYGAGALLLLPRTRELERPALAGSAQPAPVSVAPAPVIVAPTPVQAATPEAAGDGEVVSPPAA